METEHAEPRDCKHGSLARSCEICERDAEIAELKAELLRSSNEHKASLDRIESLMDDCDHWKNQHQVAMGCLLAKENNVRLLQAELSRRTLKWQTGKPPKEMIGKECWIRHGHKDNGSGYVATMSATSDEITGNCSVEELYWAGPIPEPEEE